MNLPPTHVSTLEMAVKIAGDAGLKYVYIGNVIGHRINNTYCAECGRILMLQDNFMVFINNMINAKCPFCGRVIHGI